jgi:hypothetical protein
MKKCLLFFVFVCLYVPHIFGQYYSQYFEEGGQYPSLPFILAAGDDTVWQVGMPNKTKFRSAATMPYAIITDTARSYPAGVRASFQVKVPLISWGWGVIAVRWKQKLDMDTARDGGFIEFSIDTGRTWENVFDNPYVHNYFGFAAGSVYSLPGGISAFSGTDTVWRDIWLCFDRDYFHGQDTLLLRYTFISDTVDKHKDGWMMDNFLFTQTFGHTVTKQVYTDKKIHVFPSVTDSRIHIEVPRTQLNKVTDYIRVTDMNGRMVRQYTHVPLKFFIDIGDLPDGLYLVSVGSKEFTDNYQVTLKH